MIRRLDSEVIARIAAGEVIVRPAQAIKELIENSLDASSSSIIIKCERGGLGLLQVQDDGGGIASEYLPIVCEQYTTSKLTNFDDLRQMRTFGFRGEALSALSRAAEVCIVTKTVASDCGYKAMFSKGKNTSGIKACPSLNGTTITATGLFSDWPARLNSFKNIAQENKHITDVIVRFAIHRPDVSFTFCRGDDKTDFRTKGDGDRRAVIAALLGSQIVKDMIEFRIDELQLAFSLEALLSRPISAATSQAVNSKKLVGKSYLFYINDRIVQSNALTHAVDAAFASNGIICSFVYFNIQLDLMDIDVNVHPTKETVIFRNENIIIEKIKAKLDLIIGELANRSFAMDQSSQHAGKNIQSKRCGDDRNSRTIPDSPVLRRPQEIVRMDHRERTLEQFMPQTSNQPAVAFVEDVDISKVKLTLESREKFEAECELLDHKLKADFSVNLTRFLKELSYVGASDCEHLLMQHGSDLIMVDFALITRQFFYEMVIFGFGKHGLFELEKPVKVERIFSMDPSYLEIDSNKAMKCFISNKDMLQECFGIGFGGDNVEELLLVMLPSYVHGYFPQLEYLPRFLGKLAEIGLSDDGFTVQATAKVLAELFVIRDKYCDNTLMSPVLPKGFAIKWNEIIQHVLLPKIKNHLLAPEDWIKETSNGLEILPFVEITSLSNLYKVFERC